jgi:hypothetical protein
MMTAARPEEITKIASFGSAKFGQLPIWLIRSAAYDLYLVLFVKDDLRVEISLRAEDADSVKEYLGDFQRWSVQRSAVRSICTFAE